MKLKELIAAVLTLGSRVEKLESSPKPKASKEKNAEGDEEDEEDKKDEENKKEDSDDKGEKNEDEAADDKGEKNAEGDEEDEEDKKDEEDEDEEVTQSALVNAVQDLTDKVTNFEQNMSQSLKAHKAKLDTKFEAKVKEEATKMDTDRLAQRGESPLQTGKATDADKEATSGLSGRAKVAAAISIARSK